MKDSDVVLVRTKLAVIEGALREIRSVLPPDAAGCPPGGVVMDPFGGSGTVGEVAEALGRNWILLELNPEYAELARRRVAQRGLFVEVAS